MMDMTGKLAAKFDLHVNLHVEQGYYYGLL